MVACVCKCKRRGFFPGQATFLLSQVGKNVSGVLVGVADKNDYDEQRILPHLKLVEEFDRRYPGYKGTDLAYQIAYARMNHNIISLIKYRRFIPTLYKFEIILACIPNWVAAYIIKFLHKIK